MTSAGERDDLPAIRQGLADRAADLFWRLYDKPTAVRRHELRWGRKGSLVLYLRGRNGPHWHCYETGQGGDMLSAIRHALQFDFVGALDWARDFLGLPAREDRRRERRQAEPPRARPTAGHDAEQAAKAESAGALAAAAEPIGGTLADIYLRQHRGIEAEAWPDALGFADAGTVRRCTGWQWWRWAALVVRATDADGAVTGVQLIALNSDGGAAKHWENDVKLKLSYGTLSGSAVRLSGDDRSLLLAEGPETALSCWHATGVTTWCNLGSIARAPLDGVPLDRLIVVCADDDPRNAPANKALRDAIRDWRRQGRRVVLVKPHTLTQRDKSDFNDTLRAEGREAVRARIMAAIDAGPAAEVLPGVAAARERAAEMIGDAIDDLLNPNAFLRLASEALHPDAAAFSVLRLQTGIGKTGITIQHAVTAAGQGVKIVYLVPTHRLGTELLMRIEAEVRRQGAQVSVDVWRGRTADRPDQPGTEMCCEPEIIAAAHAAKIDAAEICKLCPAAADCPYVAQHERAAMIWVGAHDLLWHEMPKPLKGADLVVIDEGFATRGLKGLTGRPALVTKAELGAVPEVDRVSLEADLRALLMPARRRLIAALRDHPEGGLTREPLINAGLTVEGVVSASRLEWATKVEVNLARMSWASAKKAVNKAARRNRLIPRFAALWHAAEDLLADDGETASGRAIVGDVEIDETTVRAVRLFGAEDVAADWRRTPTLHIDATVDMTLLRCRVPHAELVGEITADCPHMQVVQFPDRAFGKLALRKARFLFKVWDWCVAYASLAGGEWGVVVPKEAEIKILAEREVPGFIRLHHFGALRGLDELRDVRGLIVVGRPMATPFVVERMAGALSGRAVESVGDDWYPAAIEQLRARDGGIVSVEVDRHPDPLAEAVRASIAEAELLQAVGRCRGLNRSADKPVEVVLLTNVPVPGLVVDELRQWEGPTIDDEIFARFGVALESAGDAAKVAGLSRDAVKKARGRLGTFSYKRYLYGNVPNLCPVVYQLSGPGRSQQQAVYDRRRITDCQAWLSERLGPLAYYAEADDLAATEQPAEAPDPPPATKTKPCPWLLPEGRDLRPCGRPTAAEGDLCEEHLARRAAIMGWETGYRRGPDFVLPFEATANDDAPPRPPPVMFVSMT